jgi:hypothetical protein
MPSVIHQFIQPDDVWVRQRAHETRAELQIGNLPSARYRADNCVLGFTTSRTGSAA